MNNLGKLDSLFGDPCLADEVETSPEDVPGKLPKEKLGVGRGTATAAAEASVSDLGGPGFESRLHL